MTTLAVGASATVTLGDDGVVALSTNGGIASVTVAPTGGVTTVISIGPSPTRRRFGPYSEGATLTLSNGTAGQMDYDAVGSGISALSIAEEFGVRRVLAGGWVDRTVVLFGDSHTRRNGPTISGKATTRVGYEIGDAFATPATDVLYFGADGYFVIANTILNNPFRILHNTAVGGETIAQINARIDAAMEKYQPQFAVYMGGTNNIQDSGITTIAAADAAAALAISGIAAGWAKITGYGASVLAYTIPPRTSLNGFQRRAWSQVNSWIRYASKKTKGVYLAGDSAKAAGNPATGNYLASSEYGAVATANSGDDIHASTYGYYLIGAESAGRLSVFFPTKRTGLNSPELAYDATNGNNPYGNLIVNGKMLGATVAPTAPATGNIPTSWVIQGTPTAPSGGSGVITHTKVSRSYPSADATTTEEVGEWFQIEMTGGTTGAGLIQYQQEVATSAQGPWAAGNVLVASMQFETDALNWNQNGFGASPPIAVIELRNAGGIIGQSSFLLNAAPVTAGRIPAGTLTTPEVQIPAGTTRIFFRIYLRGQGTWRISDCDLRLVPDRTV